MSNDVSNGYRRMVVMRQQEIFSAYNTPCHINFAHTKNSAA